MPGSKVCYFSTHKAAVGGALQCSRADTHPSSVINFLLLVLEMCLQMLFMSPRH
jgi:hypothetical protein